MEDTFYIDKTDFIRQWWENRDSVTLITRPRRFGKTLNMSMMHKFFSLDYAGRSDLFRGLSIWEEEKFYPQRKSDIFTAFSRICRQFDGQGHPSGQNTQLWFCL
ncbi:MAG: AAA family ATPase [Firmicutes bacterium]|nr:AAA family ATPase [Bacillota bacterium]